jgi:ABC-type dipeptide/oligopeptide/nickel transport system permease subunit
MGIAIFAALVGALTGAAACYVAPTDQKLFYFVVGLLAWPIILLALLAEFVDERRPPRAKLPPARTGWFRTGPAQ